MTSVLEVNGAEYEAWDPAEIGLGGRAANGESHLGRIQVWDDEGALNDSANPPGILRRVVWTETATTPDTTLARGQIVAFDTGRDDDAVIDRQIVWNLSVEDQNRELRGIDVASWVRPAETDVERVTALLADYLDGSARADTVIADTWVNPDNPVDLDAKTYTATDPKSILDDIAESAGKLYFVTVDLELFYSLKGADWYNAPISLSDRDDEIDFVDIWPVEWDGPALTLEGQDIATGMRFTYGPEQASVKVTNPTLETQFDTTYEVQFNDGDVLTAADATARATAMLGYNRFGGRTYRMVLNLKATEVDKVKVGQRIFIKFRAAVDVDDVGDYRRIADLRWQRDNNKHPDWYRAVMELDFPTRVNGRGGGSGPSVPSSPTSGTPSSETLYEFLTWDAGEELWDHEYGAGTTNVLTQSGYYAGAAGTLYGGTFGPVGIDDAPLAVTAGDVLHISAYSQGFGESWPVTAHGRINWSWGVKFYDVADALISTATLGSFENYPQDGGWQFSETNALTVPTGAVYLRLAKGTDAGLGGQTNGTHLDQLSIYIVSGGATTGTTPPSLGGPGEGSFGTPGTYLPADAVIEHGDLSGKGGTMHDASQIEVDDVGGYFDGTTVEAALAELAAGTGGNIVTDHGSMGSTETFDATDGHDHEGTQDANLTVTLSGATTGEAAWLTLVLTQDATGGRTLTLPASVAGKSTIEAAWDTTAGAVNVLTLFSYDGGTVWYGFLAGAGSATGALQWVPVMTYNGTNWLVAVDGSGNAIMTEV